MHRTRGSPSTFACLLFPWPRWHPPRLAGPAVQRAGDPRLDAHGWQKWQCRWRRTREELFRLQDALTDCSVRGRRSPQALWYLLWTYEGAVAYFNGKIHLM